MVEIDSINEIYVLDDPHAFLYRNRAIASDAMCCGEKNQTMVAEVALTL